MADPEPESEVIITVSKSDAHKYLRELKFFLMQSHEDCSDALQFLANIEQEMEVKIIQSSISSYFSV